MAEKWESTIGVELQEQLRQQHRNQKQLADFLGVKAASVTYLLQGRIRLSQERLEQIFVFLRADAATIQRLESMWLEQEKLPDSRSASNSAHLISRCHAGLTLAMVSEKTGISVERLKELENVSSAEPSIEEIEALKKIYGCDAGILRGTIPIAEKHAESENSGNVHEASSLSIRIAEVAVLSCADLSYYRESCNFKEFLQSKSERTENYEYKGGELIPVAKVLFPSNRLGWDMKGTVELLLGMPTEENAKGLYLGRGQHGIYRMWKLKKRLWIPFFSIFDEKKTRPAWVIPIVSFGFHAEQ